MDILHIILVEAVLVGIVAFTLGWWTALAAQNLAEPAHEHRAYLSEYVRR